MENEATCLTLENSGCRDSGHHCYCTVMRLPPDTRHNLSAVWKNSLKWPKGDILKVKYLGDTTFLPKTIELITQLIENNHPVDFWTKKCNLDFRVVEEGDADVRIAFKRDGLFGSLIGNEAKLVTSQGDPTMSLGFSSDDEYEEKDIIQRVLHEFGHVMGLDHEHQSPIRPYDFNETLVIAAFAESKGWTEAQTRENIIDKITVGSVDVLNKSAYDDFSVMLYDFKAEWLTDVTEESIKAAGVKAGKKLSVLDAGRVKEMYGVK